MQISEGPGWRLVLDPHRQPHTALIGADDWAVELRDPELRALVQGVATLLEQHRQLQPSLMAEEEIGLELDLPISNADGALNPLAGEEQGSLHVALEGEKQQWALRFVLTPADGARGVEGSWSRAASLPLALALMGLDAGSDHGMAG